MRRRRMRRRRRRNTRRSTRRRTLEEEEEEEEEDEDEDIFQCLSIHAFSDVYLYGIFLLFLLHTDFSMFFAAPTESTEMMTSARAIADKRVERFLTFLKMHQLQLVALQHGTNSRLPPILQP
jgi:hypothetical protein